MPSKSAINWITDRGIILYTEMIAGEMFYFLTMSVIIFIK